MGRKNINRTSSNWPTGTAGIDYEVRHTKPTIGELDNKCPAKDKAGNCRS